MRDKMKFKNKSPNEILAFKRDFISSWHTFQALSWLDYAKRDNNISALQYAALEIRNSIEMLLFEILVNIKGLKLTESEYRKCIKISTRMNKLIKKIQPNYDKWIKFNKICLSILPGSPSMTYWNLSELMNNWGIISNYLHFWGVPQKTIDSKEWYGNFINKIEKSAKYLRVNFESATGFIDITSMPNEVKTIWEEFENEKISTKQVKLRLQIILPLIET